MKNSSRFCTLFLTLVLCLTKASALTPEEAAAHVGEEATVEGVIAQVSIAETGLTHLNFSEKFPKAIFSGFASAATTKELGADFLKSLEGKKVALTGKIAIYKEKPQIVIKSKEQIKVNTSP